MVESSQEQVREQNKQWLLDQVNHILEPMVSELIRERPPSIVDFMLKRLEEQFGERALNGDIAQMDMLQEKVSALKRRVEEMEYNKMHTNKKESLGSEDETDEDEEEDYVDDLQEVIAKKKDRGPRSSVSAEAFGQWNRKEDFKARVVPKSDASKKAILEKLNGAFMFQSLTDKEKNVVIDAMEEVNVPEHENVIKEGDQGDCLYVVGQGTLDCTKVFPGNSEPTLLKRYVVGEAFGELALLYNAPRAATITSLEECVLWQLDRDTFNHIVKDSAVRRREKYEAFLDKVQIFSTMEPYERSKLADAFTEQKIAAGDAIIKQGDPGNDLYLLQEGEAYAWLDSDGESKHVMEYSVGDYFGERALLMNEPRAANVTAKTECLLVSMSRHSVKRLLGPLEDMLKRNFEVYEKYAMRK